MERTTDIKKYIVITREDSFERVHYVEHVLTGVLYQRWETNFHVPEDGLEIGIEPCDYTVDDLLTSDAEILFSEWRSKNDDSVSEQLFLVVGKYSLPRETHTDDKGWNIPDDLWASYEEFEDSGFSNDEWRQVDSDLVFTPIALEPAE
ncbi:MAG: hypothetical protein P8K11_08155 [Gammaproteobacteria bacterium]|nr:hypothetical protein [Gammaproteobacteria bacterium]